MQFVSKAERYTLTVPGRAAWHEQVGPNRVYHRGLRAEFRNHRFDSVKAQQVMAWTDEEREAVEAAIMNAQDWGVGLYMDTTITHAAPKANAKLRCIAFIEDVDGGGEAIQCRNYAVEGKDYCDAHMLMVSEESGSVPSWAEEDAEDLELQEA